MSQESPVGSLVKVVLTAAIVSGALLLLMRYRPHDSSLSGLAPGSAAPPIEAKSWLNGPAPSSDDLAGKVVVVEAWATWCGPCRARAPHLVEVHKKYKDRGVLFVGLTDEGDEALPDIEEFIQEIGITWPNGYGAVGTLAAFGHQAIPAMWVIGRDGTIVWNSDSAGELEDGIEKALSAP